MPRKKKVQQEMPESPPLRLVKPRARKPQPSAADQAMKMTELETLRLGKLDAEVRGLQQTISLADQSVQLSEIQVKEQIKDLEAKLQEFKTRKVVEKSGLVSAFNAKLAEYKAEVSAIVGKYGLATDQFSYDTDTGLLRDLRTTPPEGGSPPRT